MLHRSCALVGLSLTLSPAVNVRATEISARSVMNFGVSSFDGREGTNASFVRDELGSFSESLSRSGGTVSGTINTEATAGFARIQASVSASYAGEGGALTNGFGGTVFMDRIIGTEVHVQGTISGNATIYANRSLFNSFGGFLAIDEVVPMTERGNFGLALDVKNSYQGAFNSPNASGSATFQYVYTGTSLSLLSGDANVDGTVNFDDLVPLAQHYNATSGQTWATGDFTGDDAVNFDDLVPLAQNYNKSSAPAVVAAADSAFAADWALAQSLVPEPVTMLLSLVAATPFITRRRTA